MRRNGSLRGAAASTCAVTVFALLLLTTMPAQAHWVIGTGCSKKIKWSTASLTWSINGSGWTDKYKNAVGAAAVNMNDSTHINLTLVFSGGNIPWWIINNSGYGWDGITYVAYDTSTCIIQVDYGFVPQHLLA